MGAAPAKKLVYLAECVVEAVDSDAEQTFGRDHFEQAIAYRSRLRCWRWWECWRRFRYKDIDVTDGWFCGQLDDCRLFRDFRLLDEFGYSHNDFGYAYNFGLSRDGGLLETIFVGGFWRTGSLPY